MAHPNAEANTEDLDAEPIEAQDQDFEDFADVDEDDAPGEPASDDSQDEVDIEDEEGDDDTEDDAEESELQQEAIDKTPTSWSNDDLQVFAKLSPEAQEIITRRDNEANRGFQEKAMAFADERKQLVAKEAAQQTELNTMQEQLLIAQIGPEPQAPHPELNNPNSRHFNPDLFTQLSAEYLQEVGIRNGKINQIEQVKNEQKKVDEEGLKQHLQTREEEMLKILPEWKNEVLQQNVFKFADKKGFDSDTIKHATPVELEILHDAMQYRAIKAAKPKVKDQLKQAPKVQKAGVKTKTRASNVNNNMKLYNSTGDDRYADKAFEEFA